MKKAREKQERWKKERREEVERKRGRDLPLLLLRAHARVREREKESKGERRERSYAGERELLSRWKLFPSRGSEGKREKKTERRRGNSPSRERDGEREKLGEETPLATEIISVAREGEVRWREKEERRKERLATEFPSRERER